MARRSPSPATPYTFTGKPRDASGLHYHRARYYAPSLGVWIAFDPLETPNRYAACVSGYSRHQKRRAACASCSPFRPGYGPNRWGANRRRPAPRTGLYRRPTSRSSQQRAGGCPQQPPAPRACSSHCIGACVPCAPPDVVPSYIFLEQLLLYFSGRPSLYSRNGRCVSQPD